MWIRRTSTELSLEKIPYENHGQFWKNSCSADINTIITMVQKKRPEDDHAINFVSMLIERLH